MKYFRLTPPLFILSLIIAGLTTSCNNSSKKTETETIENMVETVEKLPYDIGSPKSMILAVGEACGGIDRLRSLNDVEFEYQYVNPDGKKDVSKERYIFDGEISWARYSTHEVNVTPDLEGDVVQFFDGTNNKVYHNGQALEDPQIVGTGQFLRQANYMWFNMMFKLADPGINYKYEGQKTIEGIAYDVMVVTYDSNATGKEQNDTFIVYINPETRMIENFYFSLPAFGFERPVLHARLTYEEIDGIQVIVRRQMSMPSPEGEGMVPLVDQTVKNVKFNNGFTIAQLSSDI